MRKLPVAGFSLMGMVGTLVLARAATGQELPNPEEVTPPTETPPEASAKTGSAPGEESSTTVLQKYIGPWGLPAPGTDVNARLPSSARPTTDASHSTDTFDLNASAAGATVRGNADAETVVVAPRTTSVPEVHKVRKGDTLWELCEQYYGNPYAWPRVWSYNPQLQNPHWIYPGDQLRMRTGGIQSELPVAAGESGSSLLLQRRGSVPKDAVFLRDYGFIGDPERDQWGTLVGSSEDRSLLAEGNTVYLMMKHGLIPTLGQELTVYMRVRKPEKVKGARNPPGEVVAVKGTVRIDRFDPKTHLARGRLTESLDAIERGVAIGQVARKFQMTLPAPSRVEVTARILTGLYPHVFFGHQQLVFIDRGSEDGLLPGNRLFVLRRGDAWRKTLDIPGTMGDLRMRVDVPEPVQYEHTPLEGQDRDFPDEIVGELTVLRTEKLSSLALVTHSSRELVSGDRAIARRGR